MSVMSLQVLVNFEQDFALFLGGFIVDLEYSLFIVNVIQCYLMADLHGTQIDIISMGAAAKH